MRKNGWYKVKYEGRWTCAYYLKSICCSWFLIGEWVEDSTFDQIGDKIEFPE